MMTLDEAFALARSIQRDLDAGKLKVPYPPEVRAQLAECCEVFNDYANDNETAGELVRRLEAPEPAKQVGLPWADRCVPCQALHERTRADEGAL